MMAAAWLPGIAAVAAALFTWISIGQAKKELRITEDAQIAARFNAAVAHLGHESRDVQFGGIYALERVMEDSASDQPRVVSVLSAFVRRHSPVPPGGFAEQRGAAPQLPVEVVAAINVLAKQPPDRKQQGEVDLRRTDLRAMELNGQTPDTRPLHPRQPSLASAQLTGADLRGSRIFSTNLDDANLEGANLNRAVFVDVHMNGAHLGKAGLVNADLADSHLSGARLKEADLRMAHLQNTDLDRADLSDTKLTGADFSGVSLRHTRLEGSGITVDQLLSALPYSTTRLDEEVRNDPRVRARIEEVEKLQSPATPAP
ncbi:pentapeptide repeat-containing protein [Streptomyces sp. NPDC051211]|uniref:pentapeptide repeat-containing protein n=1 Tax=Streptomyces sp. NPDC051211 TaxID=3154643 RepID=UPI00344DD718